MWGLVQVRWSYVKRMSFQMQPASWSTAGGVTSNECGRMPSARRNAAARVNHRKAAMPMPRCLATWLLCPCGRDIMRGNLAFCCAGKTGARLKEDDSLDEVVLVNDHDHLLFFTTAGRAFSLRAYDVPEGSRTSTGTAVTQARLRSVCILESANRCIHCPGTTSAQTGTPAKPVPRPPPLSKQVLPFGKETRIAAMVPVSDFGAALGSAERDVVMLTRKGQIKRTALKQFASINRNGLAAISVRVRHARQPNVVAATGGRCAPSCCAQTVSRTACLLVSVAFCMRPRLWIQPWSTPPTHPRTCTCVCLQDGDSLQFVSLCSPLDSVLIAASNGLAQHFAIGRLRRMGRAAAGNKVCQGSCLLLPAPLVVHGWDRVGQPLLANDRVLCCA